MYLQRIKGVSKRAFAVSKAVGLPGLHDVLHVHVLPGAEDDAPAVGVDADEEEDGQARLVHVGSQQEGLHYVGHNLYRRNNRL